MLNTDDCADACEDAIEFLRGYGVVDGDIVDGLRDAGRLLRILKTAGIDGTTD